MSTDKLKAIIEDLLELSDLDREQFRVPLIKNNAPRLKDLRNIDVGPILEDPNSDWFVLVGQDCTPDVIWPIDHAWVLQHSETGEWRFARVRTVTAKEVRGIARLTSKYMLQMSIYILYPDLRCMSAVETYAYVNKQWVEADYRTYVRHNDSAKIMIGPDLHDSNVKCQLAIGHALRQYYEWYVIIGKPGGLSFRFGTDVIGVREILKEREKPESGSRRSALRSWITDHWRQNRHDPEEEVYVRKHLRGAERFTWNGYECRWSPSHFDILQNQKYATEREMMGRQAVRFRSMPKNKP